MSFSTGNGARRALLLACTLTLGCQSSSALIALSNADTRSPASTLTVSVYDAHHALKLHDVHPTPALPTRMVVSLPDVTQKVRIVVASGPLLGGIALAVTAHEQTDGAIALSSSDPDRDGDGVPDNVDNCPDVANPDQASSSGAAGNACSGPINGGDGGLDLSLVDGGPPGPHDMLPDGSDLAGSAVVFALHPDIAVAGQSIAIEGSFAGASAVLFPGVATPVTPTSSGAGRIVVTVPAGAGSGSLAVVSGGVTSNTLAFRTTSFATALQSFNGDYAQAGGARANVAPGAFAHDDVVRVGNYLCALGGYTSDVQCALVHADGTLGRFTTVTQTAHIRRAPSAAFIGSTLYAIGGYDGSAHLGSIEAMPLQANGTPGSASTLAGSTLIHSRSDACAVVIGPWLYVLGGSDDSADMAGGNDSTDLSAIERAPIRSDGSLGAFVAAGNLVHAREDFNFAVISNALYVFGGIGSGDTYQDTIERADIDGDGNLGVFADDGDTWANPRTAFGVTVLGNGVWVAGGYYAGDVQQDVQRATINTNGTMTTFSIVTGVTLAAPHLGVNLLVTGDSVTMLAGEQGNSDFMSIESAPISQNGGLGSFSATTTPLDGARQQSSALVIGPQLYVLGGKGATSLATIESSTIAADGTLGPFQTAAGTLSHARYGHCSAVVGNHVYVVGGHDDTGALGSIESATYDDYSGALGPFTTLSGANLALATPRWDMSCVVIGSDLYVIGGMTAGGATGTVERFPFDASGNSWVLGPRDTTFTLPLVTARSQAASVALVGNQLYVLGGAGADSSIEHATVPDNNDMGPKPAFAATGNSLSAGRDGAGALAIGAQLWLVGGSSLTTGEHATWSAPSGALSGFSSLVPLLPSARMLMPALVLGNWAYVVGGQGGSGATNEVDRAAITP